MRLVDFEGLLALIERGERFVVGRVDFVAHDEWANNRGPKCRHVPKGGAEVLAAQLTGLGCGLSDDALAMVREVSERDGFADIKGFWIEAAGAGVA